MEGLAALLHVWVVLPVKSTEEALGGDCAMGVVMNDTVNGEAVSFGLEEVSESLCGEDGRVGC